MTSSSAATRGHDVLARRRGGGDERIVVAHQADDQRRHLLRQLMAEVGSVREQHLRCALELGGSFGDGLAIGAGHQHVHVLAQGLGGAHGLGDDAAQRLVVVVGEEQDRHDSAPASLSLAMSSAALATLTPALRPGGSTVLRHVEARADVDAVVGRLLDFERLLLGLHDVGQRRIARLVEAQIRGDDGRQLELERLEAAVDLARHHARSPSMTSLEANVLAASRAGPPASGRSDCNRRRSPACRG